MTMLSLAEAVDRLERRYGLPSARTRPVIEGLLDDALRLLPLGAIEHGARQKSALATTTAHAVRCRSPTRC
jgi:hypothetical protein